jgi:hypothetical protein
VKMLHRFMSAMQGLCVGTLGSDDRRDEAGRGNS